MTRDPIRLTDSASTASASLRELLRSSASDGPTADQLRSLAGRLGPQLGSVAAAPSTARHAAGAVTVGKVVVLSAVIAATTIYWAGRTTSRPPPPVASTAIESASRAPTPRVPSATPTPSSPIDPSPSTMATVTTSQVVRRTGAHPARARPNADRIKVTPGPDASSSVTVAPPLQTPDDEVTILGKAQRALVADDANAALALTDRHNETFPSGMMIEEREAIAIEALARLGRADEARTRFDRYRVRFPRSSYRQRLERLIAENR